MTSRILQFVLGIVIYICSMPQGMARNFIPEEARACFFISSVSAYEDEQSAALDECSISRDDQAATFDGEETSPTSFQGDAKEHKRQQKRHERTGSPKCSFKTLANNSLSFNFTEKGYPRKTRTQDAREQRTEMIRFAQMAAMAC